MAFTVSKARALLYLLAAIFSLAAMGHTGESCAKLDSAVPGSKVTCPSRYSAIIGMAVFSSVGAMALLAINLATALPQLVEAVTAAIVAALNIIVLAIAASPRTGAVTVTTFANYAVIASVSGAFIAFVSDDGVDAAAAKSASLPSSAPAYAPAPAAGPAPAAPQMPTAGMA